MSTDTLSQSDIDSLLGAGRRTPRSNATMDVQVYDFRRPARVSKAKMRTLEAMYERLVKNLGTWVSTRVRGEIDIRLQSVDQFSFGEFSLSLPSPCSSFLVDLGGTGMQGLIDIGPEFGFYVIDRVFGGGGQSGMITRSLTPIERMALRTVADRIAQLTEEVWADHVPMELNVSGFESSPEMLQIASREETMLVANVEITALNQSGMLMICLPMGALERFFDTSPQVRPVAQHRNETERQNAQDKSEAALRSTPVPISVRLPQFELSIEALTQLTVGSIIPTGIQKDARLLVRAGEQERFVGQAGRVSGMLAVRILDVVNE